MMTEQSAESIAKNIEVFSGNKTYRKNVELLQTYKNCAAIINNVISDDVEALLDIGNGGLINYDRSLVRHITAVDIIFDEAEQIIDENLTLKKGSAINLPFEGHRFDMILMQNLLHHITGKTVEESLDLMHQAISQAYHVLKPGGRFLIIESTVPPWFWKIETVIFPLFNNLISAYHPPVLQYTRGLLEKAVSDTGFTILESSYIPRGTFVIQFGLKFPSLLTPVMGAKLLLKK